MAPPDDLRIGCLLPSATAICVSLGLEEYIVGVTHECTALSNHNQNQRKQNKVQVLTKDGLNVTSQGDIHKAISSAPAPSCAAIPGKEIPSFYPILQDRLELARPNVIFTQDLCAVCAPTATDVQKIVKDGEPAIISLQPTTLQEVADSFVTVAKACGIEDRGIAYRKQWWSDLEQLKLTILETRIENKPSPRLFILEWLDPPFDSGHWTYQMMDFACVEMANTNKDDKLQNDFKAHAIQWEDVYKTKPDLILVGCCGFDLDRNYQDTKSHADKFAPLLQAGTAIFACNGNEYIANPGTSLLQGVAILAQCAYHDQPQVLDAIRALNIIPPDTGFKPVPFDTHELHDAKDNNQDDKSKNSASLAIAKTSLGVGDIEDLVSENEGFAKVHEEACREGKQMYTDPESGYSVFTELAHKERGFCCGSGCRHCPYSHENVKNKEKRIQQPAIMYRQSESADLFSWKENAEVKVLFDSGGKDSFLTIRALAKSYRKDKPFGLVLLTTFDATSRNIAHQNIPIDDVVRQAKHLDITLLGIPHHRASGETYISKITRGLEVIQKNLPRPDSKITTMVFGDLHLEHIKDWRENTFKNAGYQMEYPLWKADYSELLNDLEKSQVPCFITGSTNVQVKVGTEFTRFFYQEVVAAKLDGFGENGEFHSLAKVWEVPRATALGVQQ
ncbi:unnamed protein product [Cylindrotheca closterium]|uniref:Diphthine--ammonia ligase n=1 Tax=Cylindrotheca closterium TaxID=2856 RepID=A0AAD2PX52_9STRA|nr:unnamed protein product [Cylindrotheca closterium]